VPYLDLHSFPTRRSADLASFIGQQTYVWHYLSEEMILLSKLNYPKCINRILLQSAHFFLKAASDFNLQLDNFKPRASELTSECKEYTNFLGKLGERRLTLPILTAILPRIWLASQLQERFIKLRTYGHPYKEFIEHCI